MCYVCCVALGFTEIVLSSLSASLRCSPVTELLNKELQNTDCSSLFFQTRHQRGDTHPLTLEEILDETQHLDIGLKQKQWLMNEVKKSFWLEIEGLNLNYTFNCRHYKY